MVQHERDVVKHSIRQKRRQHLQQPDVMIDQCTLKLITLAWSNSRMYKYNCRFSNILQLQY